MSDLEGTLHGLMPVLQVCDRSYYDDFLELEPGAVAEIQHSLRVAYQKDPEELSGQSPNSMSGLREILIIGCLVNLVPLGVYLMTWFGLPRQHLMYSTIIVVITDITWALIWSTTSQEPGPASGEYLFDSASWTKNRRD